MKKLLLLLIFLLSVLCIHAQNPSGLQAKCANALTYTNVQINRLGDIVFTPCGARSSIFNGNVDFSGATVTGVVSGSGTTNFIPRFTAASVLGDTPFSWNGTLYAFNNTALNAAFTMDFTPHATLGLFRVGDYAATPTTYFTVDQSANQIEASCRACLFGDTAAVGNVTTVQVDDITRSVLFNGTSGSVNFDFTVANDLARFNVNDFQIENSFSVSTSSSCAGQDTLDGAGAGSIDTTTCPTALDSVIIVSYSMATARTIPISANRTNANLFTVVGDANATFNYWIINRW